MNNAHPDETPSNPSRRDNSPLKDQRCYGRHILSTRDWWVRSKKHFSKCITETFDIFEELVSNSPPGRCNSTYGRRISDS